MKLYCDISKVEPQEDGTLKVYGYASSGAVDSDGEVVSPEAMKEAIPDYMKFGAVREMHQPLAAGTAIEASVQDDGKTAFGAHIVDPVAVKKIAASVYKGFSIGGKVTKRDEKNSKLITGLKLIEVSLVDRPANPEAIFTMYKSETIEEPAAADDPEKAAVAEIAGMLNKGDIKPTEIVAAIAKAKAPAPVRQKIVPAQFKKGMGGLSQFACLLQELGWLTQDAEMEATWEGDGSPLPMQLRDWLGTGIQIFENMVTEEISELMAALKPPGEVVVEQITSAAEPDMGKAGAKFSAKAKASLSEIHDAVHKCHGALKEACEKLGGLGYMDDKAESADEDHGGDTKDHEGAPKDKETAATPTVTKSAGDALLDQLTSVAEATDTLKGELAKRDALIEALQKRLTALEAQPMPAKGATRVVEKGADTRARAAADGGGMPPVLKADGTVDVEATLAKVIHANGPVRL